MSTTYKGFFGAEYGIKSTIKMYFNTLIIACFIWLGAAGFWYFKVLPGRTAPFPIPNKKGIVELMLGRGNVEYSRSLDRYNQSAMRRAKIAVRATVLAPIFVILIAFFIFRHASKEQEAGKQLRGSQLVKPRRLNKLLRKERSLKYRFPFIGIIYRIAMGVSKKKRELRIGKVKLPKKLETEHCCFIGRTGTGKTTMLNRVIQGLRARKADGQKVIIYDFKGDYIEKFYREGTDFLFNPLDKRTIRWNIFNEIETESDVAQIANSLIPDEANKDPFWERAARAVLRSILKHLAIKNKRTNKALWDMCTERPKELFRSFMELEECREAIRHVESRSDSSSRVDSILSVMDTKIIEPFRNLRDIDGDFSFKDWIANGEGFLFIANRPKQKDFLKPLLSLIIDTMLINAIDLEDDLNRRIFLLIDEFATLQRLPSFVSFLSTARSKGGSVWCGLQGLGTVKKTYGEDITSSIFNNFTTLLSFAISDPKVSSYIERAFGQQEVLKQRPTMQVSDDHVGHGSLSENKIEPLILASEIQNLSRYQAYLKISGYPVTKVKIPFKKIPNQAKAYEEREGVKLRRMEVSVENTEKRYENKQSKKKN